MNRENKRKQYQKGYYKMHACDDSFTAGAVYCTLTAQRRTITR